MTRGKGGGAVTHPARPTRMSATARTIHAGKKRAEDVGDIAHYREPDIACRL